MRAGRDGGERTIRSIAVAGAGIVGLSAAAAFTRAFPRIKVTLLETPPDPGALTDLYPATPPTIHRFHAAIGLDELELVGSGTALHRLGTKFERWSADGASWFHSFGEHGLKAGSIPFHQLWLRLHHEGRAARFQEYCAASALAAAGRFVHPAEDPRSPLSAFLYGLNLDPDHYRERLNAGVAGFERYAGVIVDMERRADGGIAALLLADGRRIEADLYVDCTGPQALVLGRIDQRFEAWDEWLPCNRAMVTYVPRDAPLPYDTVRGEEAGWSAEVPLPDRTLLAKLWSSAFLSEQENEVKLRSGRRPEAWVHNVLAIGDAAVALDPLHGAGLHLAHSAILRAIDLLPGREMRPVELHEYNRLTGLEQDRGRDFLALHYLRSGRSDGALWQVMSTRTPPTSLARTLEQFARRGRLPLFEEESFTRDSWLSALFGLGVYPQAVDPLAMSVDTERADAGMAAFARSIAALPNRFPPYAQMLTQISAQGAGTGGARRRSAIRSSAEAIGGRPFSGRSR